MSFAWIEQHRMEKLQLKRDFVFTFVYRIVFLIVYYKECRVNIHYFPISTRFGWGNFSTKQLACTFLPVWEMITHSHLPDGQSGACNSESPLALPEEGHPPRFGQSAQHRSWPG
jgi:hypothetical protein